MFCFCVKDVTLDKFILAESKLYAQLKKTDKLNTVSPKYGTVGMNGSAIRTNFKKRKRLCALLTIKLISVCVPNVSFLGADKEFSF